MMNFRNTKTEFSGQKKYFTCFCKKDVFYKKKFLVFKKKFSSCLKILNFCK